MTSETDDTAGRRPPTIELAATEVDAGADKAAAGTAGADTSDTAAVHDSGAAPPPGSASSGRRIASLIGSAVLGAAVMAAIAAGLWFSGVIPSREGEPVAAANVNDSAPAAPAPIQPSNPAPSPAAAQSAPTSPDVTARLDKLDNRIVELAAQTKALSDGLAALTRRVDDTAATSQSAAKQADTALNAAAAAKSANEAASKDQASHEDVDTLAKRIMALESAVKGLAATTAPLAAGGPNDRAARLSVAAEALRAAVEGGAPYQAELRAVHALGIDEKTTAALEPFAASGIVSAATLSRELAALVPALQDASEPHSGETSFLDRLKTNAQSLVRITPLNAPAGNDPQTAIDRIRLDAAHGDIAAALNDLNALPDAAKALAADWSKKARARAAALATSRQISADAVAALAQPSAR